MDKKVFEWMEYSVENLKSTCDLEVGALIVSELDKIEIEVFDGSDRWRDTVIKEIIKKDIRKAKYLFLTINTISNANEFDLSIILKNIKIDEIYIGMPDPKLDMYMEKDPIMNDNVFRYPLELQKKIIKSNYIAYSNSKQNIKFNELYHSNRISDFIIKKLEERKIPITKRELNQNKDIDALAIYLCKKYNLNFFVTKEYVAKSLQEAFDNKYMNYNYKMDSRNVTDMWKKTFEDICNKINIVNLENLNILNVGIGGGNEAMILFNNCKDITFVDIAKSALDKIKAKLVWARTINASADELKDIQDETYDIYISLRTFNSSFFNIEKSIKEMLRILKDKGKFILSIANGFLNVKNNTLIPGLLVPSSDFVDLYRGIEMSKKIIDYLKLFGIKNIYTKITDTEIYIFGDKQVTFGDKVLRFYGDFLEENFDLPAGIRIINPFIGKNKESVKEIVYNFYMEYYNDYNNRYLILGSSPAKKGSAIVGVPFENMNFLKKYNTLELEEFGINKNSSSFLEEVILKLGGREKFYSKFYMNFVFPLGLVKTNPKGNEVNCNYYDTRELKKTVFDYVVKSLEEQIKFGINTSICYCIGSGENYKFLKEINSKYNFFKEIIPLEHPRYIMQYNMKDKEKYLRDYIEKLRLVEGNQ